MLNTLRVLEILAYTVVGILLGYLLYKTIISIVQI